MIAIYQDSLRLAKQLARYDFEGLINHRKQDRFFRRFLELNTVRDQGWTLIANREGKLYQHTIPHEDAAHLIQVLKSYGYWEKFLALFLREHSWGLETFLICCVCELFELLQGAVKNDKNPKLESVINILCEYLRGATYVAIQMNDISCLCRHCYWRMPFRMSLHLLGTLLHRRAEWKKMENWNG